MSVRNDFLHQCCVLTEASVTGELLVDLFHSLDVEAAGLRVVHHGLGVMHSNNTFGCLLHALRSVPGIINILGWEPSENGQVAPIEEMERFSERILSIVLTSKHLQRWTHPIVISLSEVIT